MGKIIYKCDELYNGKSFNDTKIVNTYNGFEGMVIKSLYGESALFRAKCKCRLVPSELFDDSGNNLLLTEIHIFDRCIRGFTNSKDWNKIPSDDIKINAIFDTYGYDKKYNKHCMQVIYAESVEDEENIGKAIYRSSLNRDDYIDQVKQLESNFYGALCPKTIYKIAANINFVEDEFDSDIICINIETNSGIILRTLVLEDNWNKILANSIDIEFLVIEPMLPDMYFVQLLYAEESAEEEENK